MTARRLPSSKKTAIVPRVVFRAVATGASVIPFCVTASLASPGCGGFTGVANDAFVPDAAADALRDSLSDAPTDALHDRSARDDGPDGAPTDAGADSPPDVSAPSDAHEGG
jgi:hypothetical protein